LDKVFWPSGLAVFYAYRKWSLEVVAEASLVLLAISAWVIRKARHEPHLLVGWLWFLGTLVPVLGLVQVAGQSMADRYTYLPSIGIFIMLAWGVPELLAAVRLNRRKFGTAILVCILPALLIFARIQTGYWKTP